MQALRAAALAGERGPRFALGMIEIVKNQLDFGLLTQNPAVVDYWREEVALPLSEVLPVRRGHDQYRFDLGGTVIKVNLIESFEAAGTGRSGFESVLIPRAGLRSAESLEDPDGNKLMLVPPGENGVTQMGVCLGVREAARSRAHYGQVLGFTEEAPSVFRCGESLLFLEERADAPTGMTRPGLGWTYLTVQVRDCDAEVARLESLGAQLATRPVNLGEVARMAMVGDPDGNLLEVSQRASLTGPLPAAD